MLEIVTTEDVVTPTLQETLLPIVSARHLEEGGGTFGQSLS